MGRSRTEYGVDSEELSERRSQGLPLTTVPLQHSSTQSYDAETVDWAYWCVCARVCVRASDYQTRPCERAL